jgi:predicted NAD/FAD-binding protein
MSNQMPISGALPGAIGSPYVTKLFYPQVASGNPVLNDTNFPGLGQYIPGMVLVVPQTVAQMTVSVSTDNGTHWFAANGTGPAWMYVDSGGTVRLNLTVGAMDIALYPMAGS